jgi:hypothetical protein
MQAITLKRPAPERDQNSCVLEKWKSLRVDNLRGGAGGVVLGVAVVLASGVGETSLVLSLTSDSIVGNAGETVLALAADALTESRIGTSGEAVTSGRLAESVITVSD